MDWQRKIDFFIFIWMRTEAGVNFFSLLQSYNSLQQARKWDV